MDVPINYSEFEGSTIIVWAASIVGGSLQLRSLRCLVGWRRSSTSHPSNWAASIKFVNLRLGVLIDKLIDVNVAAPNSDLECFPVLSNLDLLCTEIVDALASNQTLEHDSEFGTIRVMVQVLCHLAIDRVTSDGEVDTELHAGDFLFETCDLNLGILELLEQLKVDFLRFVHLLFHFEHIIIDRLQLGLHLCLGLHGIFNVGSQRLILLLKSLVVSFVSDSDSLVLRNDVFLLKSSFLIGSDVFFVLRLQIGDLLLLFLS